MQQCNTVRSIRAAACVSLLTLAGCVNLTAVSDYTASAAAVLGDKAPAIRWRDSEKHLVALSVTGDDCPIGRTGRRPQADYDAAFAQAANVHDILAQYFKALGELASDKLPMPSQALDSSLGAVKQVGVTVDAADEAALKAVTKVLSQALDAYRQRKVRELMDQTQGSVDLSIGLLERLASVYADEVNGERIQAEVFIKCSIATGDLSDKYWGRRELMRVADQYKTELAGLQIYRDALVKVRKDHAEIRRALSFDKERLEQTIRAIADTGKELDAARKAVDRLS